MQPFLNPLEWNCFLLQSNKISTAAVSGARGEHASCGGEIADFHSRSSSEMCDRVCLHGSMSAAAVALSCFSVFLKSYTYNRIMPLSRTIIGTEQQFFIYFCQPASCQYYAFPAQWSHTSMRLFPSTHSPLPSPTLTQMCTLSFFVLPLSREPKYPRCTHTPECYPLQPCCTLATDGFSPQNICPVTQASLSCVFTSNKAINHLNRPQLTPYTRCSVCTSYRWLLARSFMQSPLPNRWWITTTRQPPPQANSHNVTASNDKTLAGGEQWKQPRGGQQRLATQKDGKHAPEAVRAHLHMCFVSGWGCLISARLYLRRRRVPGAQEHEALQSVTPKIRTVLLSRIF